MSSHILTGAKVGLGDLPLELLNQIANFVCPEKPARRIHEAFMANKEKLGEKFQQRDEHLDGWVVSNVTNEFFAQMTDSSAELPEAVSMDLAAEAAFCQGVQDLGHLVLTCKSFHNTLGTMLYTRSGQGCDWYALRWGCFHGSIPTVENAIRAGASVNYAFADRDEMALLHQSCDCLSLTSAGTGDANSCCTYFHEKQILCSAGTPLLTAIRGGQFKLVEWLLARGAYADRAVPRTVPGLGLLSHTRCGSCSYKIQLDDPCGLSTEARPQCLGNCGITPLQGALDYFCHQGVMRGSNLRSDFERIQVLRSLIKHGANINKKFAFIRGPETDSHFRCLEPDHHTPLGLAVCSQTVGPGTVKFLLDNGARFEYGKHSLLNPVLAHMSRCVVGSFLWKKPINVPLFDCESKLRVLLEKHTPHPDCSCFPSFDSLNYLPRYSDSEPWHIKKGIPYSGPRIQHVFDFLREYRLPIQHSHLDSVESRSVSPLTKAILGRKYESIKLLIEDGADTNIRCSLDFWDDLPDCERRFFDYSVSAQHNIQITYCNRGFPPPAEQFYAGEPQAIRGTYFIGRDWELFELQTALRHFLDYRHRNVSD